MQLADPLSVTVVLLLAAVVLLARGRRRAAGTGLVLALAWTWLLATPLVASSLARSLEDRFPPVAPDELPDADAIVVLGGGVFPAAPPRNGPDLNHAADRVLFGARLYRAEKAPLIIVTGERPFADAGPTAAEAQADILQDLGVPAEAIVAPGRSRRTATDATVVRSVMTERGLGDALLVTSALHMPRALATFQEAGVAVFPAPTDHVVTDVRPDDEVPWLPDAEAMQLSSRVLHEYIGRAFYQLNGWL